MKRTILGTAIFLAIGINLISLPAFSNVAAFKQHYDMAQEALVQNQYSTAIVEFRKALRINYLDNSARVGIINAYLARASYYANQEKNYEKAAHDFRSALFYLKLYPSKEQSVQNSVGLIASTMENLKQCLNVTSFDSTASSRYKTAESLKAMGNLSAAAYEFSCAAQSENLSAKSYLEISNILKNLGNETRSADYLKLALDTDPNDSAIRMQYARTLDKIGLYDEALPQYNEALANAKGDPEILYALERIYLKKLAQNPRDAELNANIGAIKQAQGDFDAALSYYGKAEQINPSNVTTRLNVGTLYQQKKEYQKALQAYESVLTLYPNNTQALLYKAQAYAEMGDKSSALNIYKKVLSIEPANNEAKNQYITILKQTMSPQELVAYLSKNGTSSELYDFAYKLHKENNINEAIQGYRAVIEKDSSNVNAYANLAICYASKDDYANAISILNTAKNKFPSNSLISKTLSEVKSDSVNVKLSSASASYENKDYKKAIQEYLAIKPATEDSLLGIAASYQALEDYTNAISYYKKAEEISPNNAEIPYYIGYLYAQQQNWAVSESYLRKAIKMNPQSGANDILSDVVKNNALVILNEGINLYEKNDFVNALNKLNSAISKDEQNSYAYYYRGLIYDELKKTAQAINDYLSVLKYSQDFPIVNYMLAVDYDSLSNYKSAYKYYKEFIQKYTTDDEYLKYAKSRMEELKQYAS